MFQLNNFIYKDNGVEDEYNTIKKTQKKIIRINGNDKKALEIAYELLDKQKSNLMEYIMAKTIEFALTEKALSEISDNLK